MNRIDVCAVVFGMLIGLSLTWLVFGQLKETDVIASFLGTSLVVAGRYFWNWIHES